jgi:hypothetical protein
MTLDHSVFSSAEWGSREEEWKFYNPDGFRWVQAGE